VTASPASLDRVGRLADTIEFSAVDGPGNRFVVFLQGCTLDCLACHNPQTIPLVGGRDVTVGDLVEQIRRAAPFLSGVTISGGEATLQAAFVHDLFAAIGAEESLARLTRFLDTNGDAPRSTWDALDGVLDGAMVDLKALGERHALMFGLVCGTLGFFFYGLAPTGYWFWAAMPLAALWGVVNPAAQAIMTRHVTAQEQGRLQGAVGSMNSIAGIIAPTLFTQTLAAVAQAHVHTFWAGATFWLAAAMVGIGGIVAWRVTRGE